MKRSLAFAVTLFALVTTRLPAQEVFVHARAVDEAVTAEMERQKIVGAAIGIIRDAKVVYTKGYGLADVESGEPVTEATVFNWASNCKPVMAIAAMQLVQSGELDLDLPIETYLPALPDAMKPITTRQLLCHQSGIPHYSNGKVIPTGEKAGPGDELDPEKSLRRFLKSPLIFEPGTQKDYSSYAYVLLSAVVQAAGKASIVDQLKARITQPLDLASFQFDLPFNGQENWVKSYKIKDGQPVPVGEYAHFWKHGAGGYKSNIGDFARFALALGNRELINEETSATMWTRQKTLKQVETDFGLGVLVSGRERGLKVSHSGSQDETRTRMVIYPNQGHGIVVLCNTRDCDPGKISTAIYAAMRR